MKPALFIIIIAFISCRHGNNSSYAIIAKESKNPKIEDLVVGQILSIKTKDSNTNSYILKNQYNNNTDIISVNQLKRISRLRKNNRWLLKFEGVFDEFVLCEILDNNSLHFKELIKYNSNNSATELDTTFEYDKIEFLLFYSNGGDSDVTWGSYKIIELLPNNQISTKTEIKWQGWDSGDYYPINKYSYTKIQNVIQIGNRIEFDEVQFTSEINLKTKFEVNDSIITKHKINL